MTTATTDHGTRAPGQSSRDETLVAVAHPRDDIEAALVKNLLADAGIEATVTGATLAGFRAESPADVCVIVRARDAEAATGALAAARPEIDDAEVGDDSPTDGEARRGIGIAWVFPAAICLGAVATLGLLGWWLAGLPGLEASPLDFVVAFAGLALLWFVWRKRR